MRDLARHLRVNPATVAKAYQALTDAELLEVRRGEGTFAREAKRPAGAKERREGLREAAAQYADAARGSGGHRGAGREGSAVRLAERRRGGAMSAQVQPAAPVLAAAGLEVRYGRRPVLQDVSFEVGAGTGLRPPRAQRLGQDLARALPARTAEAERRARRGSSATTPGRTGARAMQRIGVLPEEPDAPPSMSAARALRVLPAALSALGRGGRAGPARPLRRAHGEPVLAAVAGRAGSGDAVPLPRATPRSCWSSTTPPSASTSVVRRAFFEELIGELADRGTTVFVTSHDLAGLEGLADRVGILHAGPSARRRAQGRAQGALPPPARARRRHLRLGRLHRGGHAEPALGARGHRVRLRRGPPARPCARAGPRATLEVVGLTLEEIFLAVCGTKGAGE